MMAATGDGRLIAGVARPDGTLLKTWDAPTGREAAAYPGHDVPIAQVRLSADGRYLASGGWRTEKTPDAETVLEVRVWGVADRKEVQRLVVKNQRLTGLALSSDGRWLAVAESAFPPGADPRRVDAEARVGVWDVPSGRRLHAFAGGANMIPALTFSPDDRLLAAGSLDGKVVLWDTASGARVHELTGPPSLGDLTFSPDGRRLAGATREVVTLWDTTTGHALLTLRGRPRSASDQPFNPRVIFSADGSRLAANQWDRSVIVWSTAFVSGGVQGTTE
jgi:WD40 repeat protein